MSLITPLKHVSKFTRIVKPLTLSIFAIAAVSISACQNTAGNDINETGIEQDSPQLSLLDEIQDRGVLRVGTTGDFIPFSFTEAGNSTQYVGVDIVLAKNLASSLSVDVEFVQTSWSNLMKDLEAEKFDIGMSGITINLKRQAQALFSTPVLTSGKVAIARDENAHRFTTLSKINQADVRVIFNPGGTNESFARKNFPNAILIENEDNLTVFEKIVAGEADVMVTDGTEAILHELILTELDAVNPETPFNYFQMGYVMNRDHTFKAYVDQWVNLQINTGHYQEVFDNQVSYFVTSFDHGRAEE